MFGKIRDYSSPIVILLSTIAVIGFNVLANILPLNNQYTNTISDKYPTAFTPQGYVFSIWGLIYTLLALFALWTFLKYRFHKNFIDKVVLLHVLSTVFNIAWLVCWHYEQITLSMIPMVLLLLSLIKLYMVVEEHRITAVTKMTFSVYLGWISVATMANAAIVLTVLGFDGLGLSGVMWVSILLVIATLLGYIFLTRYKDKAFYLVIVWAAIGIWFKNPEDLYIFAIVFISVMLFCIRSFLLYLRNPEN
jgi:benzodiazapine receptor